MINDIVTVELHDPPGVVVLKVGDSTQNTGSFLTRDGFGITDVREALLASGQVRVEGESFRLVEFTTAERLADLVSSMLSNFDSSGVPGEELLEVQAQLQDFQSGIDSTVEIPLMAIAWLDVAVREDLADEARSASEVWSKPKLTIEPKFHRDRRMKELVKRYAPRLARPRIMTPSSTEMTPSSESFKKFG